MVTVTIDATVVYYDVTVHDGDKERSYRVRDDGWALFVKTRDNRPVGRVSFGTDSKRTPDKDSALEALESWGLDRIKTV